MPPQRDALATFIAVLLILYGGLFPFSGWTPADPLALFRGATAYRVIRDDIFVNIVVFMPLGFCAWRAARQRHGLWKSLVLASILGVSLSLAIELFQAFLPSRKASLVDVMSNLGGSMLGALAAWKAPSFQSFNNSQGTGLLLIAIALWTLVLLSPSAMITWFDVPDSRVTHQPADMFRISTLLNSALYAFGLLTVTMALSPAPARLLRMALAYVIGIYLLSMRAGTPPFILENIFGAILAFSAAYYFRQSPGERTAILGFWALAIAFIASESLPGDRSIYRAFNWIPFRGHLARPLTGIESLAQITWPVIASACALRRAFPALGMNSGMIAGCCFLAIAGFALEYAQTQLPGRFGDVTIPFVMVFTWFVCWGIESSRAGYRMHGNALEHH
ncbi:MAG: VanZ family protein [Burkholderiales bacterium]